MKPVSAAICVAERRVERSRCLACSTRISRSAASGVMPSASRKCRSSLRRLTPIRGHHPSDRERRVDRLLHQEQRLAAPADRRWRGRAACRAAASSAAIASSMIMMCRLFVARALPRWRSTMKAARCAERDAARAGQPVAVDDEDLVGDRLQPVELLEEIVVVEPADAAAIAVHQPGPVQDEGAGADARPAARRPPRPRAGSACARGGRFSTSSTSPPTTTR